MKNTILIFGMLIFLTSCYSKNENIEKIGKLEEDIINLENIIEKKDIRISEIEISKKELEENYNQIISRSHAMNTFFKDNISVPIKEVSNPYNENKNLYISATDISIFDEDRKEKFDNLDHCGGRSYICQFSIGSSYINSIIIGEDNDLKINDDSKIIFKDVNTLSMIISSETYKIRAEDSVIPDFIEYNLNITTGEYMYIQPEGSDVNYRDGKLKFNN